MSVFCYAFRTLFLFPCEKHLQHLKSQTPCRITGMRFSPKAPEELPVSSCLLTSAVTRSSAPPHRSLRDLYIAHIICEICLKAGVCVCACVLVRNHIRPWGAIWDVEQTSLCIYPSLASTHTWKTHTHIHTHTHRCLLSSSVSQSWVSRLTGTGLWQTGLADWIFLITFKFVRLPKASSLFPLLQKMHFFSPDSDTSSRGQRWMWLWKSQRPAVSSVNVTEELYLIWISCLWLIPHWLQFRYQAWF